MKRRLLIFSTLVLSVSGSAVAQQDKLITHFIYDKMSINPGETGLDQGICGTLIYRNQWDKVNGAPNSVVFNVAANLNRFNPNLGGVGISFFHDAIGFNRQNSLLLNYSHHQDLGGIGTLGIGVGIGMINFGQNPVWVPPTTQVDVTLPVGFSATNLDLNFGLYFNAVNGWYAGISSTHLHEPRLSQKVSSIPYSYQTARHYYAMGGYKLQNVGDGVVDIQGLLRTDMTKFSADINARYIWRNMLYGGVTYRTIDAVGIMVGWMPLPRAVIGYSYDITTNKLAGISQGSHEILLKYCYDFPPIPIAKSKHPRWL